jgi:hypothetical protein
LVYHSTPAEDQVALNRPILDRFRCPTEFLDFRIAGELSAAPSFFHLGPEATCYGRTLRSIPAGAIHSSPSLADATRWIANDDGRLKLPFDLNEVIDNLRLERYPGCRLERREQALKGAYYRLRPFTNRWLRSRFQKLRAAGWQKRSFPQWPVDTTVEAIGDSLLSLAMRARDIDRVPFIWFWPRGARGCVSITHDVESAAGRDFTPQLLDIDDSFGFKSSIHVVPEGSYSVTEGYLRTIVDRGFELCVQDLNHDGRLFEDRETFLRRAARINQYAREFKAQGFRSGVLYRRHEWLCDLDFSFDTSVPNVAPLDPQRGGCCTVLPYFIGNVLELPLTTIQDYSLFHVLDEFSIDLWKLQLEIILANHGLATFLVHPDYITEPETQAIYRQLLTMLADLRERESLWFALPHEIDTWWRARHAMSVVEDGNSWRIVGKGAEQAVLAFAVQVDGRLIYELPDHNRRELPVSRTEKPSATSVPVS